MTIRSCPRTEVHPRHRFVRVPVRVLLGGLTLASVLATRDAAAETAWPEGGPPFSCNAASILVPSGALPRNVPAVPMKPSSLLMPSDVRVEIVGASSTIASTLRAEGMFTWLVAPSTQPEAGDYHLRHEEECARTDGGGYERRRHQASHPFRFTEAAPLPTGAGSLVTSARVAGGVATYGEVWTNGICELRRFWSVFVTAEWYPAPELVPFGAAVWARAEYTPTEGAFTKEYGIPLSTAAPYRVDIGSMTCNPALDARYGFVNGRGTLTLRARLAGAHELPPISAEIDLGCPPSDFVGPCFDAGRDATVDPPDGPMDRPDTTIDGPRAPIDAPHPDAPPTEGGPPDVNERDALPPDVHVDTTTTEPDGGADKPRDPVGDASTLDGSRSADTGSTTEPPDPMGGRDGCACSMRKLAAEPTAPHSAWLVGFVLPALAALRRKRARSPISRA